jgi:hypothetical protein
MVRLTQTEHLSCIDPNTISKQIETRFHMTHVEFHRVRLKWFLSLWYVQRKPCSYLMPWLAVSKMDQNKHPLEPRHLGVSSGASKIIFEPMVRLAQSMHLSCTDTTMSLNGLKRDSSWPTSPRGSIGCAHNNLWAYSMFDANHAPILRQD